MNINHARTTHNERYDRASMQHPAIAQSTFICKEDGTVVFDLEAHDRFHEALVEQVLTSLKPELPKDKITEPIREEPASTTTTELSATTPPTKRPRSKVEG